MTDAHFANFIAGIRRGEKLTAPVSDGNIAVTMLQLSNIAWEGNRKLHLDTKDGRIQGNPEAMKMWGHHYKSGWAASLGPANAAATRVLERTKSRREWCFSPCQFRLAALLHNGDLCGVRCPAQL